MKPTLTIVFLLVSLISFSQNFDVQVRRFINGCNGKTYNDMDEPQMRWSLSSQTAEFYAVSKYDKSQRETWGNFNVKSCKIENDPTNGTAYIYSISSYKSGNATLMYVPKEKFIKVTYETNNCSVTYDIY
jgi:hypothetical protein